MPRPKRFNVRTRTLADGRSATYARFTDQHGVRREPLLGYDLDPRTAQQLLGHIKTDVERGQWKPPEPAVASEADDPNLLGVRLRLVGGEAKAGTSRALQGLVRVGAQTAPAPVRARQAHVGVRQRPGGRGAARPPARQALAVGPGGLPARQEAQLEAALGAFSQPSPFRLTGILESAWKRGYVSKNWGATKGRRATVRRRARAGSWIDYEPLVALLDAAHAIDLTCHRADTRNTGRRALLACLFLGAMRVSEAAQLQCRDVKWSRGVIQIPASKTAAGIAREVPMHRMLFDVMGEWWSRHPDPRPDALLVATAKGTRRDRNNIRNRVIAPAVEAAQQLLHERDSSDSFPTKQCEDGTRVTHVPSHAGRRTAITWWAEAGYDERDVMLWVGHEDPALTMRLYRQARNRPRDPRVAGAMAEVPAAERSAPAHPRS
jgi:integrase